MRKSFVIGSMVLALAGCKKDKAEEASSKDDKVEKKGKPKAKAKDEPVAKAEVDHDIPLVPPRYKGVEPLPMPAAIALSPEEQAQVADLATKGSSGVIQYGVPRGGFDEDADAILKTNPKLLLALMQHSSREIQIAAGQEIFDLQAFGDPALVPPPEYKPIVFALMTSEDSAVAASVTQSAHGGIRGENADPEIQKMLERICLDDTRALVRGAACSGVVDHLNAHFGSVPEAQAVAAKAITDEDDYVIFRTLDVIASMTWDAQYLDTLLPLLAHEETAIRGKAASIVDRTLHSAGNAVPAAVAKGHDALLAALDDPQPFVRCQAAIGLGAWAFTERWDSVEKLLPLLDDTAKPEAKLDYKSEWLEGPKDDTWNVYMSRESVGECVLSALISKANSASGENSLQFSDWDNVATVGRKAFTDWWEVKKATLLAPKAG